MRPFDWAVVAAYLTWVIWDGLRQARRSKDVEGYLLASRSLPWWLVGLSVMATQLSAITMIGTTGQAYVNGMRFLQYYFALPIAMIILSVTLVPFFHRANVFTAYQYLETRFDSKVRTFTALLFLFSRSLSTAVVISAPAVVMSVILGLNVTVTCLLIGLPTTIFTMFGGVLRDGYEGTTIPYKIADGRLVTYVSQDPYSFTFYKLRNTYYAARSNEFGYANYEIIAPPQIVINPLTEMANQFSSDLGLTEEQQRQVIPILKAEVKELEALKKDASLDGLKKVERLRQLGSSFDEKLKPFINADQQQKFQAMRDEMRKRLIERMSDEAMKRLESDIHWKG